MQLNKTKTFLFTLIMFFVFNLNAQFEDVQPIKSETRTSRTKLAEKKKAKSPASQNFRELQVSYGFTSDTIEVSSQIQRGEIRSQLQSINMAYSFFFPTRNKKILFSYGFGLGLGQAKGVAQPYNEGVKDQFWLMSSFLPGIDYRNSLQTRIGFFIPLAYRKVNLKFDQPIEIKPEDPISVGLGLRYMNMVTPRSAFGFSFTHHMVWSSTTWDFIWQYRLGTK